MLDSLAIVSTTTIMAPETRKSDTTNTAATSTRSAQESLSIQEQTQERLESEPLRRYYDYGDDSGAVGSSLAAASAIVSAPTAPTSFADWAQACSSDVMWAKIDSAPIDDARNFI